MKLKQIILLACFSFFSFMTISGYSQSVTPTVISSNGGHSSSAAGSIAWTIGEPVSETNVSSANITTMGFHQPVIEVATLIAEAEKNGGLLVYPNPVGDLLKLSFNGMETGLYTIRLNDAVGKLILASEVDITDHSRLLEIKVNEVAEGNYFLLIQNKNFNSTIKINKIH